MYVEHLVIISSQLIVASYKLHTNIMLNFN